MEIRKMEASDVWSVAGLERRCFSTPWSERSLETELEGKAGVFFVAEDAGQVIGYAGMHAVLDEGYLANVAVDAAHRRRGVASALLGALLTYARERHLGFVTLEVRANNAAAIALYEKHGFGRVGVRKRFYAAPTEDAVLMTKFLAEGGRG